MSSDSLVVSVGSWPGAVVSRRVLVPWPVVVAVVVLIIRLVVLGPRGTAVRLLQHVRLLRLDQLVVDAVVADRRRHLVVAGRQAVGGHLGEVGGQLNGLAHVGVETLIRERLARDLFRRVYFRFLKEHSFFNKNL